ncbi:MAG: helix-turn-helix domain-containing protein [Aminivibrio sp.]|jgi:hypothetical protein
MTWERTADDIKRHYRQRDIALEHLRTGQPLNQTEALERYKIRRLASRISELRKEGWLILSLRGKDACATYLLLSARGEKS